MPTAWTISIPMQALLSDSSSEPSGRLVAPASSRQTEGALLRRIRPVIIGRSSDGARIMRPALLALSLAAGFLAALPTAAQEKVVNVYNWSDYIDPEVLKEFEAETGIRVRYDVYDSNDTLESKLLAGRTGYDVVVPTQYYMARQVQAKLLRPLDMAKLPNAKHLDPALMERLAKFDPGNRHAVIYLWGTSGIGLNADKIRQRMANPPAYSLRMLFDPEVVSKFADCGVVMLDAPDEIMVAALKYLGLDPNAKDAGSIARAEEAVMKVRP